MAARKDDNYTVTHKTIHTEIYANQIPSPKQAPKLHKSRHCALLGLFRSWRRRRRRRSRWTVVEPIPNPTRKKSSEIECYRLWIVAEDLHSVWLPTVPASSIQIYIADLVGAWSLHPERVSRTPLKGTAPWIIQSGCIHLITSK